MTYKNRKVVTNTVLLVLWGFAMVTAYVGITYPARLDQFERKLGCNIYAPDADSRMKNRIDMPLATVKKASLESLLGMKPGKLADMQKAYKPGDAATVMGAVLDVVLGGEEASNCDSTSADRQTVYLYIVPKVLGATKKTALRIAITPRMRLMKAKSKIDWSFAELSKLKGKDVLATGWLYFDQSQWDYAADNSEGEAGRNVWIKTCWSLHPVTELKEFTP